MYRLKISNIIFLRDNLCKQTLFFYFRQVNILKHVGAYFLMIRLVFIKPTKRSIMYGLVMKEVQDLILGSLGIVCFLSFFVGGVVSIQTALNIESAFIPDKSGWFCNTTRYYSRICTYILLYYIGRQGRFLYHIKYRDHARNRTDRCLGSYGY